MAVVYTCLSLLICEQNNKRKAVLWESGWPTTFSASRPESVIGCPFCFNNNAWSYPGSVIFCFYNILCFLLFPVVNICCRAPQISMKRPCCQSHKCFARTRGLGCTFAHAVFALATARLRMHTVCTTSCSTSLASFLFIYIYIIPACTEHVDLIACNMTPACTENEDLIAWEHACKQ